MDRDALLSISISPSWSNVFIGVFTGPKRKQVVGGASVCYTPVQVEEQEQYEIGVNDIHYPSSLELSLLAMVQYPPFTPPK